MELSPQDQAGTLRALRRLRAPPLAVPGHVLEASQATAPRVIAVASGKGGVGKTTLVANLAFALADHGLKVLAIDGDLGLANLDLAFGVPVSTSFADLLDGTETVERLVRPVTALVSLLPACSGRYDLANLDDRQRYGILSAIDSLETSFDALVIDTAAGIGSNAVGFAAAAQQVVIVTNREPTALADAYAFIKVLATKYGVKRVLVVANSVSHAGEGEEVFERLLRLSDRFLGVGLDYLGAVVQDVAVTKSIQSGRPILALSPEAAASQCLRQIAAKLLAMPIAELPSGGVQLFWRRLLDRQGAA